MPEAPLRDDARRDAPDVRPDTSALVHALESHIKTLQGENEALKQQIAGTATPAAYPRARGEEASNSLAQLDVSAIALIGHPKRLY
jgi:hypothetical protein